MDFADGERPAVSGALVFVFVSYLFYFNAIEIVNSFVLLPNVLSAVFSGYDPVSAFSGLTGAASLGNVIRFDGYSTCDGGISLGELSPGGSLSGDTRALSSGDPDDWFWFFTSSTGNQPVTLSLVSPASSDFDAYIYRNTGGCGSHELIKSCTLSPPPSPEVCTGFTPATDAVYDLEIHRSSGSGEATFTISMAAPDTSPPVISAGSPSGTVTNPITMAVTTNENANCKYDTMAGTAYDSMADTFSTTGGTAHSTSLGTLLEGAKTYYVRCADGVSNKNAADYTISFTVNAAPVISDFSYSPAGDIHNGVSITFTITASDADGVANFQFYNPEVGSWDLKSCSNAVSCTKTWTITPTTSASRTYRGYAADATGLEAFATDITKTIYPAGCPNLNSMLSNLRAGSTAAGATTCPATINAGSSFHFLYDFTQTGDGFGTGYTNEHSSVWLDGTKIAGGWVDGDNGECGGSSTWDWTLSAPAAGAHTYTVKSYAWASASEPNWAAVTLDDSETCSVTVVADTTAPATTDDSDMSWHTSDVTVTLSCTDTGGTGCKNVNYCTVPWTPGDVGPAAPCAAFTTVTGLTASVAMTQSGYVFYKSIDNANNQESLKQSGIVKIDTNSPTSTWTSAPVDGAWVNKNGFSISVTDADTGGSNLKSCKYRVCSNIDGGTCNDVTDGDMDGTCSGASSTVTKTITVGSIGNCKDQGTDRCQVQAYAIDNSDSSNSVIFRTYKVDYTDPAVSITSPHGSSAPTFDIAWTVSDATSGPKFVGIYVNGAIYSTCSSGSACWDAGKISYTGAAGNTYNIQAYAGDVAGNVGPLGSVTSTKTVGLPSLSSPTDGGDITTLTPTLDWTDPAGANCYAVQVYDGGTLALETLSTSSSYIVGSDPSAWKNGYTSLGWQKTYGWHVWPSVDNCGSYRSPAVWSFNTRMPAPTLTSPGDGATTSPTPKLQWDAVTGANCYKADVLNSAGTIVLNTANVGTNVRDVPAGALTQGVSYKWRVSASPTACGLSPIFGGFSPQRGFTVGSACADQASPCGISYTQVTTSGPWLYNHCSIDCSSKSLIKTGVSVGYWVFTTPPQYADAPSFEATTTVGKDGTLDPRVKIGTTVDGNDICDWSVSCKRGLTPSTTYYITIGGVAGEGNAWPTVSATYNYCGVTTPPFSNSITVGSCSIAIDHIGFDYTDRNLAGDNGAVRYKDNGQLTSVDRQIIYSDTLTGGCSENMKFTNVWDAGSINPNTLRVGTIGVEESAAHDILHGYSLQTSNCKFDKNFKIVSLAGSPDYPFLNLNSIDNGPGLGLENYDCDTGATTNLNCELASGTQYIKILQGADVGAAQTLVVDLPVYECLPGENTNAAGYNDFCAAKNAGSPYCDVTLKKCYGCSITNNNPATSGNPNALDCPAGSTAKGWVDNPADPNDHLIVGKCNLISGGNLGGSCQYLESCTFNADCSTACCSRESVAITSNPGPGEGTGKCITPFSAGNPINPYLCRVS